MSRLEQVVREITHPDFTFELLWEADIPFLRVNGSTADNRNPSAGLIAWTGRKWRLSRFCTDGEVVQTAFLAVKTAQEHELRETFTYKGVTVFDPHFDIDKLVALRMMDGSIQLRDA